MKTDPRQTSLELELINTDRHVGAAVRAARKLANMTQTQLGDALGVSFQQIQKYERGTNRISCSSLHVIAHVLGRPVEWFFEGLPKPGDVASCEPDLMHFAGEAGAIELARSFSTLPTRQRAIVVDLAAALSREQRAA